MIFTCPFSTADWCLALHACSGQWRENVRLLPLLFFLPLFLVTFYCSPFQLGGPCKGLSLKLHLVGAILSAKDQWSNIIEGLGDKEPTCCSTCIGRHDIDAGQSEDGKGSGTEGVEHKHQPLEDTRNVVSEPKQRQSTDRCTLQTGDKRVILGFWLQ